MPIAKLSLKMNNSKIINSLICLIVFIFSSSFTISKNLASIPEKDLNNIRFFFSHLVHDTPAPYTLFGDKPISIIECPITKNPFFISHSSKVCMLHKSFEIWKKYSHLFPSKNYCFVENHEFDKGRYCIVLINKQSCLEIIEKNLSLFHEILEEKLKASEILRCIESSNDLFQTLKYHQGLLGLLLGFGKNNAFAFHELYVNKRPIKKLKFFNSEAYDPLLIFRVLNFAVIEDDLETICLKKTYQKQRELIIAHYQKDYLITTLERLVE